MEIFLASRSPRRKKALRKIVARFRTLAVSEPKKASGRTLESKTRYLASAKAREAARMLATRRARGPKARSAAKRYPQAVIVAADTLARCRGRISGKPRTAREAEKMVRLLSGHWMQAVTSIALIVPGEKMLVWSERGRVRFKELEEREILAYTDSNNWQSKAGAVNVEEKPVSGWIVRKSGCQEAVIGLPTKRLRLELEKRGIV